MIKHVILWKIKDELSGENLIQAKRDAKINLEGLAGKIDGLIKIQVNIEVLPTSNADMMLDSEFESVEALNAYSIHPLHVEVANTYVRPITETRLCLDFEE
jgi:hypothetical protein